MDSETLALECVWVDCDSIAVDSENVLLELQGLEAAPDSPPARPFAIDCEPASANDPRGPTSQGLP